MAKKKNHWHTGGVSSKRAAALKYGYKSGFEHEVSKQIIDAQYPLNYEKIKLNYIVPESKHVYTPDFTFTKRNGKLMYIETKGRWTTVDRKKMKMVLASNPDIDIRMIFENPNQKITKGSKTTYEVYANKLGLKHVAKKTIPDSWLKEVLKDGETPIDPKKFFS